MPHRLPELAPRRAAVDRPPFTLLQPERRLAQGIAWPLQGQARPTGQPHVPSPPMSDLRVLGFNTADDVSAARLEEVRQAEPRLVPRIKAEPLDQDAVLAAIGARDAPDVLYLDRDDIGAYAARDAI